MKRLTHKVVAVFIAGSIMANSMSVAASNSYNDSNANITSTLDRYIEETSYSNNIMMETNLIVNITAAIEEAVDNQGGLPVDEVVSNEYSVKYPQFVGMVIPNIEESLNIRSEASEEADRVGKLPAGAVAQIVEQGPEWTKIASGTVTGYVKNEYILFGDEAGEYAEANVPKQATINTETLYVRAEEDTTADCVSMVPLGETYKVIAESDAWAEIEVDQETVGYVSKEYVTVSFVLDTAVSKEEEEALIKKAEEEKKAKEEEDKRKEEEAKKSTSTPKSSTSSNSSSSNSSSSNNSTSSSNNSSTRTASGSSSGGRSDICDYALQFVGNPYVYAGTSLTNGADCSGFVMSVYANFGYGLPHSSSAQSGCGSAVDLGSLVPGDLVFYANSSGSINHVAIFIGNGQVVHASSPETGIKVSNVNYRSPYCARRIG